MAHSAQGPVRRMAAWAVLAVLVVSGCGGPGSENRTSASGLAGNVTGNSLGGALPPTTRATAGSVARVIGKDYNPHTHTVRLQVQRGGTVAPAPRPAGTGGMEDTVDLADKPGIINYVTANFPDKAVHRIVLIYELGGPRRTPTGALATPGAPVQYVATNHGWVSYHKEPSINSAVLGRLQAGEKAPLVRKVNPWWYEIRWQNQNVYITTNPQYTHVVTDTVGPVTAGSTTIDVPVNVASPAAPSKATTQANAGTIGPAGHIGAGPTGVGPAPSDIKGRGTTARVPIPPPGVTLDPNLRPVVGTSASVADKTRAVLSVAKSKLGTPYIWGHNEDEGQTGFDCSNFVEYVFHHALGYQFTTASRKQYQSVGVTIPTNQMQPGDILVFNHGGHVGIYAGNDQMIQEGGGLGKVGYVSMKPGSYWRDHLTVVRRMY
ncbi:C40 family peptidase [Alicyclobacillus herbarius]|uniref:C40 family peptidase n=1 Tax=Alicyclobacillus herbarius TaxID=122960 RepID=UPI000427062C|nr:C40 family peptidase [Alicyclobacillus herbarius]